jgi:hypothetical protein
LGENENPGLLVSIDCAAAKYGTATKTTATSQRLFHGMSVDEFGLLFFVVTVI